MGFSLSATSMDSRKNRRTELRSWIMVAALTALCLVLGGLQYKWIGDVSVAERERMRNTLRGSLQRLSRDFNSELIGAAAALVPPLRPGRTPEDLVGYPERFQRWRPSARHPRLFRRLAVARRAGEDLTFFEIQHETGEMRPGAWPAEWLELRKELSEGGIPMPRRPFSSHWSGDALLIVVPASNPFEPGPPPGPSPMPGPPPGEERPPNAERRPPPDGPRREFRIPVREWLLLQVDPEVIRAALLPELLARHLGEGAASEWEVEVTSRDHPRELIFAADGRTAPRLSDASDARTALFDVGFDQVLRRSFGEGGRGPGMRERPGDFQAPDRGRWWITVRHRAGSLEAVVGQVRTRNLALSGFILALMLASAGLLILFTGRAQRLAELQMTFVAGVSHELRTPLSVIRTASHNLQSGVVTTPQQVKRYGALIEEESERLTSIVEGVLRFASMQSGKAVHARVAVEAEGVIGAAVKAMRVLAERSGCVVEVNVEPGLPPLLGDPVALEHVLQNLISNAVKYGGEGAWVGIRAARVENHVELSVSDRGPGIPAAELPQVFDAFYRGRTALENQIHGTGLGLSIVHGIVKALQGTIDVRSAPGEGTTVAVRLPIISAEQEDEFANPVSGG